MSHPAPWRPPDPLPGLLETARLEVRPYVDADAPALQAAIGGHRSAYLPWLPWAADDHADVATSRARIRLFARQRAFAEPTDVVLGMFEKGSGDLVGGTGLHRIDAPRHAADVGYWLHPARRGRGFATEGVGALVTSAFEDWGLRRVTIECADVNRPSWQVAERLGLRLEALRKAARWVDGLGWADDRVYAALAHEWDVARHARRTKADAGKAYAASHPAIAPYVEDVLEPEDEALAEVRRRAREAGLPDIAIGSFDARHLEVIVRAAGARRVVEIGTLGGYSALAIARALPDDGVLHTFELEPRHAEVARGSLARAGVGGKVQVHVGPALERLADVEGEGPFDLVFVDADKASYPAYLAWAERHLRLGGTLVADNVFRAPRGRPHAEPVDAFNRHLARSGRWRATLLPVEDGLAVAVRIA